MELEVCEMEEGESEETGILRSEEVERKGKEEARRIRGLGDPLKPRPEEVEEHKLTHMPYRNWCGI